MRYLTNAFSVKMLANLLRYDWDTNVSFRFLTPEQFRTELMTYFVNAVGHQGTVDFLNKAFGLNLTVSRQSMTPFPPLRAGFALGVSIVTPPTTGLLNNPAKQGFINLSQRNPTTWGDPALKGEEGGHRLPAGAELNGDKMMELYEQGLVRFIKVTIP